MFRFTVPLNSSCKVGGAPKCLRSGVGLLSKMPFWKLLMQRSKNKISPAGTSSPQPQPQPTADDEVVWFSNPLYVELPSDSTSCTSAEMEPTSRTSAEMESTSRTSVKMLSQSRLTRKLPPSEQVIKELSEIITNGDFYVAQYRCKLFSSRYNLARRYAESLDILESGAYRLLENKQFTSGAELGVLLVETLIQGKFPCVNHYIGFVRRIYASFERQYVDVVDDSDEQQRSKVLADVQLRLQSCSSFIHKAIRWSVCFSNSEGASQELYDMLADLIFYETPEDIPRISFYYVRGKNPKNLASALVNFIKNCYQAEGELAIGRAILMYLSLGKLRDSIKLWDELEKFLYSEPAYSNSDLLHFVGSLIQACYSQSRKNSLEHRGKVLLKET